MEMSLTYVFLFLYTAFTSIQARKFDPCYQKIKRGIGQIEYPSEEENMECQETFQWEMRLFKRQSLRLIFFDIDLRDTTISVQMKPFARRKYREIQSINGSEKIVEIIIEPPNKFVRFVMNGIDGSFKTKYEVFYCAIPPPMLNDGECSNRGYRKFSICNFRCRPREYYPTSPRAMDIRARCKGTQMWSQDFEHQCTDLGGFEEMCYDENSKCPFNDRQIMKVFDKEIDLKQYLSVVARRPEEKKIRLKSHHEDLASLDTKLFLCTTVEACKRTEKGIYLHKHCADHPNPDYRKPCFVCRNIHRVCTHDERFASFH